MDALIQKQKHSGQVSDPFVYLGTLGSVAVSC